MVWNIAAKRHTQQPLVKWQTGMFFVSLVELILNHQRAVDLKGLISNAMEPYWLAAPHYKLDNRPPKTFWVIESLTCCCERTLT